MDQFVKHKLRIKNYFRYADDFIIVHADPGCLEKTKAQIAEFLKNELSLDLHPGKVVIRKFRQGIDFLGYVVLPHHIALRTKTKRRMFNKLFTKQELLLKGQIDKYSFSQSVQSYLGILKNCNGHKLGTIVKNNFLQG